MNDFPIMELRDWNVQRDGKTLTGPLNLSLRPAEITVLMSPSGVGKTSTVLTALGYQDRDLTATGSRTYLGVQLSAGQVPEGPRIYIPQNLPFNPNFEVGSFLCRLRWGKRAWWHPLWPSSPKRLRRVREVLETLGMAGRMRATLAEMSGGEAQRAALAQLFLLEEGGILFVGDEFVTSVDTGLAFWILDQCRQVITRSGGAALLALHDGRSALQIADHIVLFWANEVDRRPWFIEPGSPFWDADALHALLCLARWSKDLPICPAIGRLLDCLHGWKENPARFHSFVQQHGGAFGVLDDAGELASLDEDSVRRVVHSSARESGVGKVTPVRCTVNGYVSIGLAFPAQSSASRFTLVARTTSTEK